MKRLSLAVLLILCLTMAAAAAEGTLFHEGSAPSIAACDGELYILRHEGLFRYDPTTGDEVLVDGSVTTNHQMPNAFGTLLSDGKTLYGYRYRDETLTRLDTLETVARIDDSSLSLVKRAVAGDYFVTVSDHLSVHYLDVYSLEDGSLIATWPVEGHVLELTGYRQGHLLMVTLQSKNRTVTQSLVVFDPLSGESTVLGTVDGDVQELSYDAQSDSIYLCDNNCVYRWTEEGPALSVYKLTGYTVKTAIFGDGLIATQVENDVDIRRLGSADEQTLLTIRKPAGHGTDYQAFLRAHPEVSLVFTGDASLSAEDQFARDMVNRDASTDIYVLSDLNLLTRINQKGFGVDLSGLSAVRDAADDMVPPFRRIFDRDGQIYALPEMIYLDVLGYQPEIFERFHLPVPTTYDELFDLLALWAEDGADAHPEIGMDVFWSGDLDLYTLLSHYASECAVQGKPVVFNTQALTRTVERYMELNALEALMMSNLCDEYTFNVIMLPYTQAGEWMPLSVSKDAPPVISPGEVTMYYLVVNPYTAHREEAMAFMESLTAGWSDLTRAVLLLSAGPQTDEEGRSVLSQEQLDGYHAIMDNIVIADVDPLPILADEQPELFDLLEDGLMNVPTFLRTLDERTRLIRLEMQ